MPENKLPEDMLAVLALIAKSGGTDCTGTCHHRKPGEFHCHTFANRLNLSSQGVKNRILELLRMGLLQRERVERKGSTPLVRFLITPQGQKLVDAHNPTSVETKDPS